LKTLKSHQRQVSAEEPNGIAAKRRRSSWILFKQNKIALIGFIIFLVFFAVAVLGLFLTSGDDPVLDPSLVRLQEKLKPPLSSPNPDALAPREIPSMKIYLFGTDDLGRDVLARMLQGAWVSLTVGFVAVGIAVIVGIILGGLAGYFGSYRVSAAHLAIFCLIAGGAGISYWHPFWGLAMGSCAAVLILIAVSAGRKRGQEGKPFWVNLIGMKTFSIDTLIMRLVDIMLCFPSFFLILTVVALLPASIYNIMAVIGLTSWMGTTRFVRAEFLSLREQDFVIAARALGLGFARIIFRHMMPNALAPVLVSTTIGIASAILTEAGLSFLGFGVPPPYATWGNILSDGKRFIFDAPWLTFIPGLAILIVVLSFNLFGEGIKDALNPRLKERG